MIRSITLEDTAQICEIYNYYVLNTTITFEKVPIETGEMEKRIQAVIEKHPFIVYEQEGQILGYAYASKWKPRYAYKQSVESTVYLKHNCREKGIGTRLYAELIDRLISMNTHTIIGGVALPNDASIRLHEKFGFKKVAHFKEVGFKFEQWIDVAYWQLITDRD